ncbi:hypothetical protein RBB50_010229 [Rhinocladiella similis]
MERTRISLPSDVIVIDRPGFRGRRFTTEKTEERIRREKEEREKKYAIRCQRRDNSGRHTDLDIELQKTDSIINLRDSLLRELAIRENISQGFSSVPDRAAFERLRRSIEKARYEITEALKTLF